MQLFFRKKQRLKSEKDIDSLFETGKTLFVFPIKMVYSNKESSITTTRVLTSVPKKYFKKAVVRNMIKRRIKEAYRINQAILSEVSQELHVAFIYVSNDILTYKQIEDAVVLLLRQLKSKYKAP